MLQNLNKQIPATVLFLIFLTSMFDFGCICMCIYLYVQVYTCMCTDACVQRPQGFGSLGFRVMLGCEPPNVGAGIRTLVLTTGQQALLIAEPYLQSLNSLLCKLIAAVFCYSNGKMASDTGL